LAYELDGDRANAIADHRKALSLNPALPLSRANLQALLSSR
jgi:Flp pilus assembly protein TadD